MWLGIFVFAYRYNLFIKIKISFAESAKNVTQYFLQSVLLEAGGGSTSSYCPVLSPYIPSYCILHLGMDQVSTHITTHKCWQYFSAWSPFNSSVFSPREGWLSTPFYLILFFQQQPLPASHSHRQVSGKVTFWEDEVKVTFWGNLDVHFYQQLYDQHY